MLRLFIAVELPDPMRSALATLQDELAGVVPRDVMRWVRPEGIHLTLKFLGDVPEEQCGEIETALMPAAGLAPFTVTVRGLGCFPNFRRPRVVWVGLEGQTSALHALRDLVEREIAPLGYPTERRKFHPHLTLGRVRRRSSKHDVLELGEQLAETSVTELGQMEIASVSLMRSQLRPQGAIYSCLKRVDLEGTDGEK